MIEEREFHWRATGRKASAIAIAATSVVWFPWIVGVVTLVDWVAS